MLRNFRGIGLVFLVFLTGCRLELGEVTITRASVPPIQIGVSNVQFRVWESLQSGTRFYYVGQYRRNAKVSEISVSQLRPLTVRVIGDQFQGPSEIRIKRRRVATAAIKVTAQSGDQYTLKRLPFLPVIPATNAVELRFAGVGAPSVRREAAFFEDGRDLDRRRTANKTVFPKQVGLSSIELEVPESCENCTKLAFDFSTRAGLNRGYVLEVNSAISTVSGLRDKLVDLQRHFSEVIRCQTDESSDPNTTSVVSCRGANHSYAQIVTMTVVRAFLSFHQADDRFLSTDDLLRIMPLLHDDRTRAAVAILFSGRIYNTHRVNELRSLFSPMSVYGNLNELAVDVALQALRR